MSNVANYIVLATVASTDDEPPLDDLPSPWVRLDEHVIGDHKVMEARVYGRVTNHGPGAEVIAAELALHPWGDTVEVRLLAKEQDDYQWRDVPIPFTPT